MARETVILFRVSESEKRRYRRAAKRAQRSMSDWIRSTLDGAAKQHRPGNDHPGKEVVR